MENADQPSTQLENIDNQKKGSNAVWILVGILLTSLIIAIGLIFYLLGQINSSDASVNENDFNITLTPTPTPNLDPTYAPLKKDLDRLFSYPILDDQGEVIAEFTYSIKAYEITKEVVINGRRALITDDKIVLVFDVEINNETNKAFNIMSADYLRLSVNGEDKWIASEVNSDPVEVRPESTKNTRVGFTILESDSNLRLQVGEVDGEKEIINISDIGATNI